MGEVFGWLVAMLLVFIMLFVLFAAALWSFDLAYKKLKKIVNAGKHSY